MPILGFGDLRDLAYPSLWDLQEIKKVQLADGTTFDRVLSDVNAALRIANSDLLGLKHIDNLFAVTNDVELEYPVGTLNGIEEATEYSTPVPGRGKMTGHSLPIKPYDRALGWTMMYLRKARQSQIDADVQAMIYDIKNDFPKKILTRFFKVEAENVGSTTGASVPLADGGTADSNYVPLPSPDGKTFLYTHNHYLREATIADGLLAAVPHLLEHGHTPPFDVVGSEADQATWKGVTGWKTPTWGEINYMNSTTERAPISDITQYYGYIETSWGIVRVWLTNRVPTGYFGIWKPYGAGDPRNPLRLRVDKSWGFGWQLVPGNWVNAPTAMAVGYTEYGTGIGTDRTNGVLVKVAAAGAYSTPTIS